MYSRASKRLVPLALAFGVVGLLVMPALASAHVHPKGATPTRVALVPSYGACTSPNNSRPGPLSGGSCSPPVQASSRLTLGSPDANGAAANSAGYVRIEVCPVGNCVPPDDVIETSITDVRCLPAETMCDNANPNTNGSNDYTGSVTTKLVLTLTDHDNTGATNATSIPFPLLIPQYGGGQCLGAVGPNCAAKLPSDIGEPVAPAASDEPANCSVPPGGPGAGQPPCDGDLDDPGSSTTGMPIASPCLPTPSASIGSTCNTQTTVNTITGVLLGAPAVKPGKLANVELGQIQVLDSAGSVFEVQGIYNP